jgi:prepilin-type N-terminal cleavage/methylation domain-containing protein
MRDSSLRCRAFTLIELLVVLAILGVLLGLILAAVQRARDAAARAACQDHLRNLGLAALHYENALGRLPPGPVYGPFAPLDAPDGVSHGPWAAMLGYLEENALASSYRFDVSFDDPANQPAISARVKILECPSAPPDRMANWGNGLGGVTDYEPFIVSSILVDKGYIDKPASYLSPMAGNGMVRITDVTDGTSSTILIAEASGQPGMAWSSPEGLLSLKLFFGNPVGMHWGGSNACMVDGSVHFLSSNMSLRVLGRLATAAGGEVVSGSDF